MPKDPGAYNIYEAKTKLSQLVSRARRGKEVILMNHGEPVAMIVPIPRMPRQRIIVTLLTACSSRKP